MRRRPLLLVAVAVACGSSAGDPPKGEGARYLSDQAYRRAELEASLVSKSNDYARLRLAHYAGGDAHWDALPEWNPRVDVVHASEIDDGTAARVTMTNEATALAFDATDIDSDDAMRALGERAFTLYPAQSAGYARAALASRAAAARYGVWVDEAHGVGGLVRAELADGSAGLALTCASCHTRIDGGALVVGVGNDRLDVGSLLADTPGNGGAGSPFAAWGRGRVDVTTDDGSAPVRIPDLRPTRWLTHLHHDATVAKRDRTALAIRIETLIIAHEGAFRPPRAIAWALAVYLESLADALPTSAPAGDAATGGAATFAARCASCHAPPGFTGPPVPLDVVGTDPAIGLSADRGTGFYRVPSLRGVGSRPLLFHDASLPSLAALLDPTRTDPAYAGGTRGPGPVQGHLYGLDLDASVRSDLLTYLSAL